MSRMDDLMVSGASEKLRRQLAVQMWAVALFGLVGLGLAVWRVLALTGLGIGRMTT